VAPATLKALLPVLAAGLLPGLAVLAWQHWRRGDGGTPVVPDIKNPTELRTALTFAAVYAVVLLLAAWLSDVAGEAGLYAVALASGLTDVDAITLSSLRLHNSGGVTAGQVVIVVVLAVCANTVFKLGLVLSTAGKPLFLRCAGPVGAAAAGLAIGAAIL
jgi:uncharacterized membrane protein (DUF4010 family)